MATVEEVYSVAVRDRASGELGRSFEVRLYDRSSVRQNLNKDEPREPSARAKRPVQVFVTLESTHGEKL